MAGRKCIEVKLKIDPDDHSPVSRHRHHSPSKLPPPPSAYSVPSANACKQELLDIPLKKAKHLDESFFNYHQQAMIFQYSQPYAFRPWAAHGLPPHHASLHANPSSKHPHHPHGSLQHHPHHSHHMLPPPPHTTSNLPPGGHHLPYHVAAAYAAAGPPAQMPYRGQEPPLLQNPERVVLHSESEQFERSFQPNVALQPRKSIVQPPPPPITSSSVSNPSEVPSHSRERERELEKRLSPLVVHIKLERPSTPLEDEPMDDHHLHLRHEEEEEEEEDNNSSHQRLRSISPPSRDDSPTPPPDSPLCLNTVGHLEPIHHMPHDEPPLCSPTPPLQTAPPQPTNPLPATPPQSHCGETPSPPIPSPEGHSGSNEITSSTSPVPAATSSKLHRSIINPNHVMDNRDSSISGDDHRQSPPNPNQPLLLGDTNHIHHHHHHHLLLHKNQVTPNGSPDDMPTTGGGHKKLSSNSELELSTDTDDDSLVGEPDSSNNNPIWDSVVEALKDTHAPHRDRVLHVVKQLLAENAATTAECSRLRQELRRRDSQISELKLGPINGDSAAAAMISAPLPPRMNGGFHQPTVETGAMSTTTATTTTTKAVAEVIRMPLKKSLRCSLDGDHAIVRSTTSIGIGRLNHSDSSSEEPPIVRTTADA